MAEDLLLVTALAAWKDRAAAVQAAGSSVQMRDLRTTAVAAKTVKLDEEGRKLSQQIHEQLEHRVKAMETKWLESIDASLTEQKVAAALQAVASPPDRSLRCPAELAVRIAAATSEALNAELSPTDWIALLRVAAESPMKRSIKPAGIPADENAQAIARSLAGSIPALAQQLGLKMPPPPPKRSSVHRRVTPPANSAG
jgi:translation elongation factor EF-Ts